MTIDQFNFAGKKAIVRVDFNVPLDENGNVTDDTRIRGALPTLKKVLADGGALIMMSHMGKPKGKVNPKMSLGQITENVAKALGTPVKFAPDMHGLRTHMADGRYCPYLHLPPLQGTPAGEEHLGAQVAAEAVFHHTHHLRRVSSVALVPPHRGNGERLQDNPHRP